MYMPAVYVTNYAQQNSQNRLSFDSVEGTVFSGQAKSATFDGLRLKNVNWELSPLSLLLLKANLDINGGDIRKTNEIHVSGIVETSLLNPESFSLSNMRILVPVKPMLAQLELPVTIVASGRFRIDIASIDYDEGCQSLAGKGSWMQAAMNINGKPLDLGGFDADLSCEAPAFAMQIAPTNGIELDAKITVDPSGKYSAKGKFSIPDNFPNEVKQGAVYFGESIGQGKYNLNIKSG